MYSVFFFKQKTAYEMRISDWSSDVCSSDLVHDDGIGIAQDDIPLVLQPFNQVRDAYLREKGGTGLGLPIVVGMARLHGGDFTLRSTLGAGTSARSEERRVGKEGASTSRSRWSPFS